MSKKPLNIGEEVAVQMPMKTVASLIVGTYTGIKYIVNLTDSSNGSVQEIVNLQRDLEVAQKEIVDLNTRLASAEATWTMAENLYRTLADQVREHDYDIKDINRDLNN